MIRIKEEFSGCELAVDRSPEESCPDLFIAESRL